MMSDELSLRAAEYALGTLDPQERTAFARLLATDPAARAAAGVLVHAESSGRAISHGDAQIAGICLAQGHELATRNVRDFAHLPGLTVIDPFDRPE